MNTGDAVQTAAPTAQAQILPLSGSGLTTSLHLGVQGQERFVSLGETGIQAHFLSQTLVLA